MIKGSLLLSIFLLGGELGAATFTVKGGLNQSALVSGYTEKSLTGFQFSLAREWRLAGNLFLAPELAFVRRGTAEGIPSFGSAVTNRIRLDCLEVPLLLRWRPGKSAAGFRPVFYAGGYAAYVLSMRSEMESGDQSWVEPVSDDVKRLDFGWVAGAGFEFPLFGRTFVCEGRFHMGLTQLNKISYYQAWKTSSLSLLVGMRL